MGMLDKVKFWKKSDDDLGGFNLDDFSLDNGKGAAPSQGMGPLPGEHPPEHDPMGGFAPLEEPVPGMQTGVPTSIETMQPSQRSQQMGEQIGLSQQPRQSFGQAAPQQAFRPQPEAFRQGPDLMEIYKELEIMHAKIDAIRSTLDSINQRLATLERVATGDTQKRYAW